MCYVFAHGYFGAVIKYYLKGDGYYILKFTYNTYNLQEDVRIDRRIILMGEKVANAC